MSAKLFLKKCCVGSTQELCVKAEESVHCTTAYQDMLAFIIIYK